MSPADHDVEKLDRRFDEGEDVLDCFALNRRSNALTRKLESRLGISIQALFDFCECHGIAELSVFGSLLRDDFDAESDVDFLVTFAPDVRLGLLGWIRLENELKTLLRRDVDLVSRRSIEDSDNWIRRQNILGSAELLYVAG